jgi:hypothetical protein
VSSTAELMNTGIPLAEEMLRKHGEFSPSALPGGR